MQKKGVGKVEENMAQGELWEGISGPSATMLIILYPHCRVDGLPAWVKAELGLKPIPSMMSTRQSLKHHQTGSGFL